MKKLLILLLLSSPAQAFEVMGAIRNDGNGFYVISDSAHRPLNICNLQTTTKEVTFDFCGKKASMVNTLLVAPDETYAAKGIIAGASVGLERVTVQFGNFLGRVNPKSLTKPGGNFWIYGRLIE